MLRLTNMGAQTLKDPLLVMFGKSLLNKQWRTFDKQFVEANNLASNIIEC